MVIDPCLDIGQLREIGWSRWNPIGLDEAWRAAAPDEYDRYLLHAANLLLGGASKAKVTTYLTGIASHHMGLSYVDLDAANAAAAALETYVQSLASEG